MDVLRNALAVPGLRQAVSPTRAAALLRQGDPRGHFAGRPRARELFEAFCAVVEEVGGPVRLSIAKTRIGLITSITFAAVMPRKDYLRAHLLLWRRVDSSRFVRIDDGPPQWVHHFEIRDEADLDDELRGYLRESYLVGEQDGRPPVT